MQPIVIPLGVNYRASAHQSSDQADELQVSSHVARSFPYRCLRDLLGASWSRSTLVPKRGSDAGSIEVGGTGPWFSEMDPGGSAPLISFIASGCNSRSVHKFLITAGSNYRVDVSSELTDLLPLANLDSASRSQSWPISLTNKQVAMLEKALEHYRSAFPSSYYARQLTIEIVWGNHTEALGVNGPSKEALEVDGLGKALPRDSRALDS